MMGRMKDLSNRRSNRKKRKTQRRYKSLFYCFQEDEVQSQREHEDQSIEGESNRKGEGRGAADDDSSTDQEVHIPLKKKDVVPPRKSSRLASKGITGKKKVIIGVDDDSSSHITPETHIDVPNSSPKPAKPPIKHTITSGHLLLFPSHHYLPLKNQYQLPFFPTHL